MANFKIALSAGHGRNTAGKRCLKAIDPNETREWVLNSRIAEKAEDLLLGYTGWELLRVDDRTGAKDIGLSTRSNASNAWGADLYLAIHHNAAGVTVSTWKGGGIVAFVHTKPTAESVAWRDALYSALIAETGLTGNRSQPLAKANFHEVREPKAPAAVLLELGFMDSAVDVPIILTEEYADQCARAIVKVIAQRGKLTARSGSAVTESTTAQETAKEEQPAQTEVKVDSARKYDKAKAGTYKVKSSDGFLNLRSGAAIGKTLIEAMPNGTTFRCYGYYTGDWLYGISASGKRGFCHGGYLEKV